MTQEDNDKLKTIAIKVLEKSTVPKEENSGFAIITLLMIISIVLTIIRVIQECNKVKAQSLLGNEKALVSLYGEDVRNFSLKAGWYTKMRIKKLLRRELSKEDYKTYADAIMKSLLQTGESLTDDEVQTLVRAANV